MKAKYFSVILLAAVILVLQKSTSDMYAVAIAGCCKHLEGSRWVYVDLDFDQCVRTNAAEDEGDDIFEPTGSYWWDVAC